MMLDPSSPLGTPLAGVDSVYLVRHAQPADMRDERLRYDIPPGPPLSPTGRTQAAMAAEFLQGDPPAIIYTSPLERALQTAQVIAARLGTPLAIDERLAEHRREESDQQVAIRLANFWHERVTTAAPRGIALITHGSPIRLILAALGDILTSHPEHYRFDHGNIVPFAGIWRARCTASQRDGRRWDLALVFRTLA